MIIQSRPPRLRTLDELMAAEEKHRAIQRQLHGLPSAGAGAEDVARAAERLAAAEAAEIAADDALVAAKNARDSVAADLHLAERALGDATVAHAQAVDQEARDFANGSPTTY